MPPSKKRVTYKMELALKTARRLAEQAADKEWLSNPVSSKTAYLRGCVAGIDIACNVLKTL